MAWNPNTRFMHDLTLKKIYIYHLFVPFENCITITVPTWPLPTTQHSISLPVLFIQAQFVIQQFLKSRSQWGIDLTNMKYQVGLWPASPTIQYNSYYRHQLVRPDVSTFLLEAGSNCAKRGSRKLNQRELSG